MHTPVYSFKKNIRKEKKLVPVKSFKSDALTIGPRVDTTKSITKSRVNVYNKDGRRTVDRIRGPPEITRGQALSRIRTKLNKWYNRVLNEYTPVWLQLGSMDPDVVKRKKFNPSLVRMTVLLLEFEREKLTSVLFEKNPPGQIPEWQIPLKLLMDNINTLDFGDESVYKRVPPDRLEKALRTFITKTMNWVRYLPMWEVSGAIDILDTIAYYNKYIDFDDNADDVYYDFIRYTDNVYITRTEIEIKLLKLRDRSMKLYLDELSRKKRGEETLFGFSNVWLMIKDVSEADSPFEKNDGRLWVFNDIEKFISEHDLKTYHDIKPDQLKKMWSLFINNVLDNTEQKLEKMFSFDKKLDELVEKWIW